jgi:hypothetical protein
MESLAKLTCSLKTGPKEMLVPGHGEGLPVLGPIFMRKFDPKKWPQPLPWLRIQPGFGMLVHYEA